jgi:hypothetical protein
VIVEVRLEQELLKQAEIVIIPPILTQMRQKQGKQKHKFQEVIIVVVEDVTPLFLIGHD